MKGNWTMLHETKLNRLAYVPTFTMTKMCSYHGINRQINIFIRLQLIGQRAIFISFSILNLQNGEKFSIAAQYIQYIYNQENVVDFPKQKKTDDEGINPDLMSFATRNQ